MVQSCQSALQQQFGSEAVLRADGCTSLCTAASSNLPAVGEAMQRQCWVHRRKQLLLLVVHSGHFPCINKIISEAVLPQNCTVVFAAAGP